MNAIKEAVNDIDDKLSTITDLYTATDVNLNFTPSLANFAKSTLRFSVYSISESAAGTTSCAGAFEQRRSEVSFITLCL